LAADWSLIVGSSWGIWSERFCPGKATASQYRVSNSQPFSWETDALILFYCRDPVKMTTPNGKAQPVLWFIETKPDKQTQRNHRIKYGRGFMLRVSCIEQR